MKKKSAAPVPAEGMTWLVVVRVLCILAFALSAYLLWGSLRGERLPGCGVESGCSAVLSSRWAYVLGIPVSLPALLVYAGLLAATVAFKSPRTDESRRFVLGFMIAAAIALLAAGIWFVCLQILVIRSICPFCMSAHACGFLAGALLLAKTIPKAVGSNEAKQKPALGGAAPSTPRRDGAALPIPIVWWLLAGLAPVALLALGQMMARQQTYAVSSAPDLAARKAPRILKLHGDAFELDLNKVPLHGSPEAPCVIVHLFDYSCPHCRALHPILVKAGRLFSDQVAIASLPMPLATNCNWVLKRPIPAHVNACAYADCGLAVWRANPAKLPVFDDWFFAPPLPPTPQQAEAEAMRLVGTNEYKQALSDPWIQDTVQFSIRLYATNYYRYHKGVLPELLIGTNLVSGQVPSLDELGKLLATQFNLTLPEASPKKM